MRNRTDGLWLILVFFAIIIFLTSCEDNPTNIDYVGCSHEDRTIQVASDAPLSYSTTWMGFSDYWMWSKKPGWMLWVEAYNHSDKKWYGYIEGGLYPYPSIPDTTEPLVFSKGILTSYVDHNAVWPKDTLNYIPAKGYSESLTFFYWDIFQYQQPDFLLYWRFVPDSATTLPKWNLLTQD